MIGWLQGEIVDKREPGKIVLNVNGVGYDIETSLPVFFELETYPEQQPATLHIHTLVREDAFILYGFLKLDERSLFRALIRVNGVGPKLAMAILSSIQPEEFVRCIQQENSAWLTKLPGIGKKTAERLVVEMKDRLKLEFESTASPESHMNALSASAGDEAVKALQALGYKPTEATKAIKSIDDGDKTCEALIKEGLKVLSSTC